MLPLAFEYSEFPDAATFGDLKVATVSQKACGERFKLRLAVRRQGEQLKLEFHFDSGCLDRATVAQWSRHYLTLLSAAGASSSTLIGKLPLLGDDERRRLLIDWNQTAVDYPCVRCIHELFEDQAARTPDEPALRHEDECLTYRELNERANRLAHHLRAIGVKADSLVALCIDRSTAMIVAVLAILKAGGAYVPLSADHPKARLAQQLARTSALITESKFECLMPSFHGATVFIDRDREQWCKEPVTNPVPISDR